MINYVIVAIHGHDGPVSYITDTEPSLQGAIARAVELMRKHNWYAVGVRPASANTTRLSYVNLFGSDEDTESVQRLVKKHPLPVLPMRDNPLS